MTCSICGEILPTFYLYRFSPLKDHYGIVCYMCDFLMDYLDNEECWMNFSQYYVHRMGSLFNGTSFEKYKEHVHLLIEKRLLKPEFILVLSKDKLVTWRDFKLNIRREDIGRHV